MTIVKFNGLAFLLVAAIAVFGYKYFDVYGGRISKPPAAKVSYIKPPQGVDQAKSPTIHMPSTVTLRSW